MSPTQFFISLSLIDARNENKCSLYYVRESKTREEVILVHHSDTLFCKCSSRLFNGESELVTLTIRSVSVWDSLNYRTLSEKSAVTRFIKRMFGGGQFIFMQKSRALPAGFIHFAALPERAGLSKWLICLLTAPSWRNRVADVCLRQLNILYCILYIYILYI